MKVLVLGSGGREHALVWKISQSPKVDKIYCAPGNGGIAEIAEIPYLDANDNEEVLSFVREKNIDLTVVGPEVYLVNGIVDLLEDAGFKAFGPRKAAAELEASKIFTKEFLKRYQIPTGDFEKFDSADKALDFLKSYKNYPVVIKADGLAAGKGVVICDTRESAKTSIKEMMLENKFGNAGSKIIIEEFLEGNEISILTFVDSETLIPMELAKDYKKIDDNDEGLNTGGMGCISPNPNVTPEIELNCNNKILNPVLDAIKKENMDFRGVLFIGIIYTKSGPKVLEFNVRFGDPETQAILPRMKSDIINIFLATINKDLKNINLEWYPEHVCTVVLAAPGYPESYPKGMEISGLNDSENFIIFHAGTKIENDKILTDGGRVLNITAKGNDSNSAIQNAYRGVSNIHFNGIYYRKDIGK